MCPWLILGALSWTASEFLPGAAPGRGPSVRFGVNRPEMRVPAELGAAESSGSPAGCVRDMLADPSRRVLPLGREREIVKSRTATSGLLARRSTVELARGASESWRPFERDSDRRMDPPSTSTRSAWRPRPRDQPKRRLIRWAIRLCPWSPPVSPAERRSFPSVGTGPPRRPMERPVIATLRRIQRISTSSIATASPSGPSMRSASAFAIHFSRFG